MDYIEFFKLQAKNFLKDYNNRVVQKDGTYWHENPRFFKDIEDIIMCYDINEEKPFTLMNAQHIIANIANFNKWSDLIHANKFRLELGKLLFENRNYEDDKTQLSPIAEDWKMYEFQNLRDWDDESKLKIFKIVFLNDKSELN